MTTAPYCHFAMTVGGLIFALCLSLPARAETAQIISDNAQKENARSEATDAEAAAPTTEHENPASAPAIAEGALMPLYIAAALHNAENDEGGCLWQLPALHNEDEQIYPRLFFMRGKNGADIKQQRFSLQLSGAYQNPPLMQSAAFTAIKISSGPLQAAADSTKAAPPANAGSAVTPDDAPPIADGIVPLPTDAQKQWVDAIATHGATIAYVFEDAATRAKERHYALPRPHEDDVKALRDCLAGG